MLPNKELANTIEVDTNVIEEVNQQNSRITQLEARNYKTIIEHFFNTEKPFLNPNYSLELLVTDLKLPRYLLSAFINKEYNMGFREFLNRYRIEYMITHIHKKEWEHFTLEAIAEECGFVSRNTFIKNFKDVTGKTPSDYFKKL